MYCNSIWIIAFEKFFGGEVLRADYMEEVMKLIEKKRIVRFPVPTKITINYIPHKCHADYLDYEQDIKELLDPDEEAVKKLLDECKMAPKRKKSDNC